MISGLVGFVLGALLSWQFLLILLFIGIIAEHIDAHGFALFVTIAAAVIAAFYFKFSFLQLSIGAVVYLAAGIAWSFWRYKRYVQTKIQAIHEQTSITSASSDFDKRVVVNAIGRLAPSQNVSRLSQWIIIWPLSFVENVTSDLIDGVKRLVTDVLKEVYDRIYLSAVGDVNKLD